MTLVGPVGPSLFAFCLADVDHNPTNSSSEPFCWLAVLLQSRRRLQVFRNTLGVRAIGQFVCRSIIAPTSATFNEISFAERLFWFFSRDDVVHFHPTTVQFGFATRRASAHRRLAPGGAFN